MRRGAGRCCTPKARIATAASNPAAGCYYGAMASFFATFCCGRRAASLWLLRLVAAAHQNVVILRGGDFFEYRNNRRCKQCVYDDKNAANSKKSQTLSGAARLACEVGCGVEGPPHARESPPPPPGILTMHSRQSQFQQHLRVQIHPLPAHGQMQMRTGGASRAAAQSDRLPFADIVAFLNRKFRQMQIERQQALAMVDHHTIPLKEQRPRQDDAPAINGGDRRSGKHAQIEPLMGASHGTVEDALDSEHVRDLGIHGSSK